MLKKNIILKEIWIILGIKVILLYGLWHFCFSHPIDKNLTAKDVASRIFTTSS